MTMPSELKNLCDDLATKAMTEDFDRNPDGYTVAPYVNEYTVYDAFEKGFNACYAHLSKSAMEFELPDPEMIKDLAVETVKQELALRRPKNGIGSTCRSIYLYAFRDGARWQFEQDLHKMAINNIRNAEQWREKVNELTTKLSSALAAIGHLRSAAQRTLTLAEVNAAAYSPTAQAHLQKAFENLEHALAATSGYKEKV